MNEFFTWDFLKSYAGAIVFIAAVTQIAKYYISINPKWISLIAAVVVVMGTQIFYVKDLSAQGILLAAFNVVAVLCGSIGLFESVIKPIVNKISQSKDNRGP